MKKVLALMLVITMVFALGACANNDESKPIDESAAESVGEESKVAEESKDADESKDEEQSKTAEESEEVSEEVSEEESVDVDPSTGEVLVAPDFTNKFVSYGTVSPSNWWGDGKSVRLTGYNVAPSYGCCVMLSKEYGNTIAADGVDFSEYAVLVAEYDDAPYFGYVKQAYYNVGEANGDIAIPEDGFVIVVHKSQTQYLSCLSKFGSDETIFPHGIQVYDVGYSISYTNKAPTVDGVVNNNEYGNPVQVVDVDNPAWDYSQFTEEDYDIAAKIYVTYDADYLYIAVVVEIDYHYCPSTTNLWNYCSIQMNLLSCDPNGEYISQYYDWGASATNENTQASNDGVFKQYGFAVSSDGTSCSENYCSAPAISGEYKVVRDEANQTTTYEIKLPWSDVGIEEAATGTVFGLSFSLNAREDDTTWKNVKMRNGGGIIGRNDLSKVAAVTLK